MATVATRSNADGLWLGSLSVSLSLGFPDEGVANVADYQQRVAAMRRVSSLPILVDIDAGCLANNSIEDVVSTLAAAGANGLAIEDKSHPKVNSFADGTQQLTRLNEFLGILSTALKSRSRASFVIVARSDALVAGLSVDEALRRMAAYQRVGVDGVFVQSTNPDPTPLLQVLKTLDVPAAIPAIGVIPTAYPQIAAATWGNHGASVVVYANQLLRASVPAMAAAAAAIVGDQTHLMEDRLATVGELLTLLARQNA